jgi:hypothetical protein
MRIRRLARCLILSPVELQIDFCVQDRSTLVIRALTRSVGAVGNGFIILTGLFLPLGRNVVYAAPSTALVNIQDLPSYLYFRIMPILVRALSHITGNATLGDILSLRRGRGISVSASALTCRAKTIFVLATDWAPKLSHEATLRLAVNQQLTVRVAIVCSKLVPQRDGLDDTEGDIATVAEQLDVVFAVVLSKVERQ